MITKASKCKATACIGFILMWNVWGIYLIENGANQVTGRQVEICWLWYFLSNITIPSPTPPPPPSRGVCVFVCPVDCADSTPSYCKFFELAYRYLVLAAWSSVPAPTVCSHMGWESSGLQQFS